jgi:hypothetical protein
MMRVIRSSVIAPLALLGLIAVVLTVAQVVDGQDHVVMLRRGEPARTGPLFTTVEVVSWVESR